MRALTNGAVPEEQIDALDTYAQSSPGTEMQELLQSLVSSLRDGKNIVAFDPTATLTPQQAADRLGMSRTHLYKLLDAGKLPFDRVGRDRRIHVMDLVEFEGRRQADRRELAERFAHQDRTRVAAADELADLL